MSEQETPVEEHTLSKIEKNVKVVFHKSCQCYFRIETLELIFIDEAYSDDFEKSMVKLCSFIDKQHHAKSKYSQAIEDYGIAMKDIANKDKLTKLEQQVVTAEIELEQATQNLQSELGEFNEQTGYHPIIELIPIQPLKKSVYGRCYSYMKKCDYEVFKPNLTVLSLDIFSRDAILTRDDKGNIVGINVGSIKSKLLSAQNAIKQMMDNTMTVSAEIDYEKTLTEWADAWNRESAKYDSEGSYIDVSAGAQFLRFTANASALNTWNADNGKAQIKGEAKADLTIFSGTINSTIYTPDRIGWPLKFMISDTKEANIGILRAKIDGELTGYVGASAQVEENLQFVIYNNKQLLMGNRTAGSRFVERKNGVRISSTNENARALEVNGQAFGGAKIGASLGGALQWLKPFDSLVSELPHIIHTFGLDSVEMERTLSLAQQSEKKNNTQTGQFQDFASLTLAGDAELGAGLSGEFRVRFVKGRFRFHIKGSLCLLTGAKGEVEGEITPELFGEFAIWVVYQLYGIDYKHLTVISKEAFMALSYILVMGGESIYKKYYNDLSSEVYNVVLDFNSFIKRLENGIKRDKYTSSERNDFAIIINSDPRLVYRYSPEAKGIALYILTGDGSYDRIDIDNQGDGFLPDTNKNRKIAVLHILSSIQTKREWKKVLSRITMDGVVSSADEDNAVATAEEKLRQFLQIGFNRDKEMEEIIDKLNYRDFKETFRRLKDHPAYGYAFSPNCSKTYAFQCEDSPFYRSLCYFEPTNPEYKEKWEPVE
ncbi:hypothetical protein EHJ13_17540 [Cronobacter dublinensis]|uniref:ATPase n=1 Tax=Cronobacter dublinensis TaxID=413497 RepID=A0A9Q4T4P8_9ENTR|nr:hypothetical protein [Cronobacter dublinensis]NCH89219.1 hypothetical protein [Cronobacter dublinensis]